MEISSIWLGARILPPALDSTTTQPCDYFAQLLRNYAQVCLFFFRFNQTNTIRDNPSVFQLKRYIKALHLNIVNLHSHKFKQENMLQMLQEMQQWPMLFLL